MYPYKPNMNNNNTNNGNIPSNVPNLPLWGARNDYQNMPMVMNNVTNTNPYFMNPIPSNVLMVDRSKIIRPNIQINQPSTSSSLYEPNGPNFNRTISNYHQVNNNMGQNHNIPPMKLPNNLFNSKTRPRENEFKINFNEFPALPDNPRPNQMKPATTSLNGPEQIQEKFPSVFSGQETQRFDTTSMPPIGNLRIGERPQETRPNSESFSSTSDPKNYVQVSSNGKVTNLPGSMLRDQFGIAGELVGMKQTEENPSLTELNIGGNMCTLGMNLSSAENIYPSFTGPLSGLPLGPHRQDFNVPVEYRFTTKCLNLPDITTNAYKYEDDLLFYMFYTYHNEKIQLFMASQLQSRGWRFHMKLCVWILPIAREQKPGESKTCEDDVYYIFDYIQWRIVKKQITIDFRDLEGYEDWKLRQNLPRNEKQ